ncbi:hypothetical protein HYH03_010845 [Edaphochlamys debaryana]|uniref:Uncharacterized protein n=1 Tax=Edaphochlamys debaryana TaxID=47281 RepID=A0A836BVI4_9CHLO|nr:hypothetical protein HYH03_010845 [Edaphochlamys debaryana]|eukprot:KAG2490676.1 hypothetical protein HYH03_010845 [Edaphochlamys debaryana]
MSQGIVAASGTLSQGLVAASGRISLSMLVASDTLSQGLVAASDSLVVSSYIFGESMVAAAAELKLGLSDVAHHHPSPRPRERGMPVRCTAEDFRRGGNLYYVFPDGAPRGLPPPR